VLRSDVVDQSLIQPAHERLERIRVAAEDGRRCEDVAEELRALAEREEQCRLADAAL
jgi:hypothetical protein